MLHEAAEYAGPIAARRAGIDHAQVAISRAQVERSSLELASPELDAIEAGSTADIAATPYLTRFPAALDPSPYATTLRYREADTDASAAVGSSIYVTLGTVAGSVAEETPHRKVVEAVLAATGDDVEIVVTTGRPMHLGPLPSRVRVEAWLDQDVVLQSAAAVVCHGGSGTLIAALRHGVPIVVVPMFADQHGNCRLVAEAGAGLGVHRQGSVADLLTVSAAEAAAITAMLGRVLREPAFRASGQRVAAEMAHTDLIDQLLSSLICQP